MGGENYDCAFHGMARKRSVYPEAWCVELLNQVRAFERYRIPGWLGAFNYMINKYIFVPDFVP